MMPWYSDQVSVSTTAVPLLQYAEKRTGARFKNVGSTVAYILNAKGAAQAKGYPLQANEELPIDPSAGLDPTSDYWAITASSSTTIGVFEQLGEERE